jgi:hypothetical protein
MTTPDHIAHAAKETYWTAEATLSKALHAGDTIAPSLLTAVDDARQTLASIAPDVNGQLYPCTRCSGQGGAHHWPGFTCYECSGYKMTVQDIITMRHFPKAATLVRQHERHLAELAASRAAQAAALEATQQWASDHGIRDAYDRGLELEADRDAHNATDRDDYWADTLPARDSRTLTMLRSISCQLTARGSLSDKQISLMRQLMDRLDHTDEVTADVVTGDSVQIIGTIIASGWKDTQYGSRQVMTVRDDRGFTVWGTQPAAISSAVAGDRLTLTAQVTASDRDTTFGFIKRPKGISLLDS